MLMLFFYFFFFFRLVSIYIGGFFLHIFVVYLIINLECIIQKSKYIRVNYKDINLEMKPLILISILALFYLGHAIVDRTYFSYLGTIFITHRTQNNGITWGSQKSILTETSENRSIRERVREKQKTQIAQIRFIFVNIAFDTLSNDRERQKY